MQINEEDIRRIVREVVTDRLPEAAKKNAGAKAAPKSKPARAAVLTAPGRLELREFPVPQIADDEVLVRVEACGICGTDVHCHASDPFGLAPVVLGHEGTGEVVEVGRRVVMDSVGKPIRPGDKIVTSIFESSDACMVAKYNPLKANLCDDLRIYGLLPDEPGRHLNGYFAEYLVIRAGSSMFVVNDMPLELRVLIEPAAVVCHALDRARQCGATLNFRSRVIVQGCGPIGLMMVAVLRTFGINTIIAIDGNPGRLATARSLGADATLNYKDYDGIDALAAAVNKLTKGLGAHFGFQVTGVPAAFANLFHCIRRGGGFCEVGHFIDGGECAINPHQDICRKEITVTGSWAYNSFEYPNAYHFLQRAERIGLPVASLVTHRFPLENIREAFAAAIAQTGVKIMVVTDAATPPDARR